MGKAKKEHRKKVAARNQRIQGQQNAMQKLFNESMRQQIEELKKQREAEMSGETQTTA
jgi:DNA-binding FrmR family transcriptional regulator